MKKKFITIKFYDIFMMLFNNDADVLPFRIVILKGLNFSEWAKEKQFSIFMNLT